QGALALARMSEAITMPTEEIPARPVELGDASAAGDALHLAGADEIRSVAAKPAWHADHADGLRHVLPFTAGDAHAIGEMQLVVLGPQIDPAELLAVACPLPRAGPAGAQATRFVQLVHVDRAAGFHPFAPVAARPSRSEATHHAPPFFSEIVWQVGRCVAP